MLSVILLSIGIPCIVAAAFAGLRRRMPATVTDMRGIALQTVIIMVVLIAIAGAIAAVLVTRGGQAVDEIQRTNITAQPSNFKNKTLCEAANFHWVNSACQAQAAPPPPPPPPQALPAYTTRADCEAKNHVWSGSPRSCSQNPTKSAYTVQADCTEGGGTWDAGASSCSA